MVSFTASFAFLAAAIGAAYGYTEAEAEAALTEAAALSVGEYYRPPTHLTSGAVNATTPFRRSPCPAMNTLTNHGYLPRDGKNITVSQALSVVMDKFNIGEDLAAVMGGLSPDLFDLNDLSKHNDQVEHDASLARIDSYFGEDPYLITPGLINDVLNYGLDGSVDVEDVAKIRAARAAWGEEHNPEFDFSTTPAFIAGAESALFLRGFGGDNGNSTATTFVATFFLQEMFPEGWTKPDTSITYNDALATISYLDAVDVLRGGCHGSQVYGRSTWMEGVWAIMYSWYFPKDSPSSRMGHRHDWEHVIVFIDNPDVPEPKILACSVSSHDGYKKYNPCPPWVIDGTSLKVRYKHAWPLNHDLDTTGDGGSFQDLIMWDQMTEDARCSQLGSLRQGQHSFQ